MTSPIRRVTALVTSLADTIPSFSSVLLECASWDPGALRVWVGLPLDEEFQLACTGSAADHVVDLKGGMGRWEGRRAVEGNFG
jgi:hypothetical protein